MRFCSQLCNNILTADQVLVLAKWSQEFIRPKISYLPFVTGRAHGLEVSSKKVKKTNKLGRQTD